MDDDTQVAEASRPTAPPPQPTRSSLRIDLRAALAPWMVARVVVAASLVAAHLILDQLDNPAPSVVGHVRDGLLGWDARWYERIAAQGYEALPDVGLRFFPLLPLVARPLGWLLGDHHGWTVVVVSNAAALAFGAMIHRLCLVERGDTLLARRATWFVALTPTAFVFAWGYAESLAGFLAVGCFLALRTRRWGWAAAAGFLAGLTRPVGVLLAIPAAIEGWRGLGSANWRQGLVRALPVVSPFAGCAAYLAWVGYRFGDPLLPFTVQQGPRFRGDFANPLVVLWKAAGRLVAGELSLRTSNALHLPWALLLIALVVLTFRTWPVSYGAFAAATLLVALSTDRLGSFERYAFAAFPVVLTAAVAARRGTAERFVIPLAAVVMGLYGTLALLGAYVP